MKTMIALLVALGLLSACVVEPEHHGHDNGGHGQEKGGDFCPPGQAKKGNC
jgi:hypothetical protein